MKKLLVLALVLGIAGFASAGLQLIVNQGQKTVSVVGQTDGDMYVILVGEGAPLFNFVGGAEAPSLSGYADDAANWDFVGVDPGKQFGEVWVVASAPGEAYKNGVYLTASWTDAVQKACLFTYDEINDVSTLVDCQVPEPMTMALLALGGLFIRRK